LEASGPPPGPEPTTIYSYVLLLIVVAATTFTLSKAIAAIIELREPMMEGAYEILEASISSLNKEVKL
jgi:hypothetical protein